MWWTSRSLHYNQSFMHTPSIEYGWNDVKLSCQCWVINLLTQLWIMKLIDPVHVCNEGKRHGETPLHFWGSNPWLLGFQTSTVSTVCHPPSLTPSRKMKNVHHKLMNVWILYMALISLNAIYEDITKQRCWKYA